MALREAHPEAHFTLLVRSPSDGEKLKSTSTTIVIGNFSDYKRITSLTAEADIVINAADCDDVSLAKAILAGLKQKQDEGRGIGALIHTSGELIFNDGVTDGTRPPNRKVWNVSPSSVTNYLKKISTNAIIQDKDSEAFRTLKAEQRHAPVDILSVF